MSMVTLGSVNTRQTSCAEVEMVILFTMSVFGKAV